MGPVKCLGKLKFGVFGLFFGVFQKGSKRVFLGLFLVTFCFVLFSMILMISA